MVPETFTRDSYVTHMRTMYKWAARRFTRLHPMLSRQDLEQEAVIPLLLLFDKEGARKPPIELCRLGRMAVIRHLRQMHRHAFRNGDFTTPILDLDLPITQDGKPLADIIGTAGLEDIFFWFALEELERLLGDLEQKVLTELLAPSEQTLQAYRDIYNARQHNANGNKSQGNYVQRDRLYSLSTALNVPIYNIRNALFTIQRQARKIFATDLPSRPYMVVSAANAAFPPTTIHNKGDGRMTASKGVIPDAADPLLGEFMPAESEGAASQQKAAKEKKAKTAPASGRAAAKPKPKSKKDAKGKSAAAKTGKSPKAKKEPKEAKGPRSARGPRVVDPEHPFREGTNADVAWKYLVSLFNKGGKDKVVTAEDAAKAFEKVGKKDADAAKSGSYFLYWAAKHGMLTRTDRGAYTLTK